jgi:hypothetical protein
MRGSPPSKDVCRNRLAIKCVDQSGTILQDCFLIEGSFVRDFLRIDRRWHVERNGTIDPRSTTCAERCKG